MPVGNWLFLLTSISTLFRSINTQRLNFYYLLSIKFYYYNQGLFLLILQFYLYSNFCLIEFLFDYKERFNFWFRKDFQINSIIIFFLVEHLTFKAMFQVYFPNQRHIVLNFRSNITGKKKVFILIKDNDKI